MRTTFNIYVLIFLRRVLRYQRGIIGIRKQSRRKTEKKNDKRTNNDLQNIAHKTKDRVTRTPIKAMYNLNYGVRHLNCQNNK